jgi:GrpB-like predicted nucleotidyltransferase (UPF0157 family)
VLVVVKDLDQVKNYYKNLQVAGFEVKGRGYVTQDDEYVHQDDSDGNRLVSVHILQEGNPKIEEYKIFRDYLRVNAQDRELYISTKEKLYALYGEKLR